MYRSSRFKHLARSTRIALFCAGLLFLAMNAAPAMAAQADTASQPNELHLSFAAYTPPTQQYSSRPNATPPSDQMRRSSSGLGILDALLLAGGLMIAFRVARGGSTTQPAPHNGPPQNPVPMFKQAYDAWARLRQAPPSAKGPGVSSAPQPLPLDKEEFLRGAKAVFVRLQQAWDARDLDDMRHFMTPEAHARIVRQAKAEPMPGATAILLLRAEVYDARLYGTSGTEVTVHYDVLLQDGEDSRETREVWTFRRESSGSLWRLAALTPEEA